jgi:tetratricopeptide (TPR) repeat protein
MRARFDRRNALLAGLWGFVGLVAGWALAQLGPSTAGPTVLAAGPATTTTEAHFADREPDRARPGLTEVRPPRVEIEESPHASSVLASPGTNNAQPSSSEVAPELREELTAYLRSGSFEQQILHDGDATRFLVTQYLQIGDPQRAQALLARFPHPDSDVYGSVASALLQAGDRAAARDMYLAAIERDPLDTGWIEAMRDIDPGAALAAIDAQVVAGEQADDPLLAAQRATLLAAVGRTDEAKELLAKVLAKGSADDWTLEALLEVDPEWAERELRQRLEGEDGARFAARLAEHLVQSERGEEGAVILEQILARDPGQSDALQSLLQLAPERGIAALQAGGVENVDPWLLSQAGHQLAELGRSAEAVDLWLRATATDLSDQGAVDALVQHAPDRFWEHCRSITVETSDDELLGDVADIYWSHGRRDEAIQLWQRARSLDPGDGEWREKLRAASRGLEPL